MKSVQRKAAEQPRSAAVRPAEPAVAERSPARPLPQAVRARMEATFGADFSEVTLRQDGQAAAMDAVALTRGSEIAVDPAAYDPSTTDGLEVLGHELAHVLQQRAGRVPGTGFTEQPDLEAEADEAGRRAAQGQPVTDTSTSLAHPAQGTEQGGAQTATQPMRRSPANQPDPDRPSRVVFPPMMPRVAAESGGFDYPARPYDVPSAPQPVSHEATHARQPEPQVANPGSGYAYEDEESLFRRNQ